MQIVYKILLGLCLFGLSVLVPAVMVLITREQIREEESRENP